MRRDMAAALEPHLAWLAGLRWIGRWEPAAFGLGAFGTLLAGISGLVYLDASAGGRLLAGHLLFLAAISVGVARPYGAPLLALCGLSGLHVWLWLMQGFPHGREIVAGYLLAGLAGAVLAGVAGWRNSSRWLAIAHVRGRDEFRWLVTAAPLLLRCLMAQYLARRQDSAG